MAKNRVALILSGSGHMDGAEITEAVSLLIAFSDAGYDIDFYAPNRNQLDVINHITHEAEDATRNIMVESARIARGKIKPVESLDPNDYSAIAMAGGLGVVKNFTTFIQKGVEGKLLDDVAKPLYKAVDLNIPIVAICAAPLAVAMLAHEKKIDSAELSFGDSKNATDFLNVTNQWGVKHFDTDVESCHIDSKNRLITAGAYMYDNAKPHQIFHSARACVDALKTL